MGQKKQLPIKSTKSNVETCKLNQTETNKLDEVVRKMAKINLKDTKPTEAQTSPNQNIADCDKHVTPYSKPS